MPVPPADSAQETAMTVSGIDEGQVSGFRIPYTDKDEAPEIPALPGSDAVDSDIQATVVPDQIGPVIGGPDPSTDVGSMSVTEDNHSLPYTPQVRSTRKVFISYIFFTIKR